MPARSTELDSGKLALLDAVPERLLVCLASGPIVYVHPLTETLLGTPRTQLVGKSVHACLLTEEGAPFSADMLAELVKRGADTATPVILKHPQGVHLHMLLVAKAQTVDGQPLWFLSLRDRASDEPTHR